MRRNEPRSLPDWIEDGYNILVSEADDHQTEFSHERAHELLLAQDSFPDESVEAEYAIEYLLNYGWLYEVEGNLRITDSDY